MSLLGFPPVSLFLRATLLLVIDSRSSFVVFILFLSVKFVAGDLVVCFVGIQVTLSCLDVF